jgi:hypothetical protein
MACNAGPDIIEDGLVLCLDAGNNNSYPKSGTTWSDLAGSNNGTLTNMDSSNFSNDGAGSLTFDGTDAYISSIGNLSTFTFIQNSAEFSISAWVFPFVVNQFNPIIGNTTGSAEKGWFIRIDDDATVRMAARRGVVGQSVFGIKTSNTLQANQWVHLFGTGDGSLVKLYINSNRVSVVTELQGENVGTLSTGDSTRVTAIGINPVNTPQAFNGRISLTQIYNRALTPDEIRQNYQATVGRFT